MTETAGLRNTCLESVCWCVIMILSLYIFTWTCRYYLHVFTVIKRKPWLGMAWPDVSVKLALVPGSMTSIQWAD